MAFENVAIRSTRNGISPVVGYREDLAQSDTIALSLTSTVGVSSVKWELIGRPEFSGAGGSGANPWQLGTALTAAFVVDVDAAPVNRDGTYTVSATINPGSPGEARKTVILRRLTGLTIAAPGGLTVPLAKLGPMESFEDTSVANLLAGWATMLNRWLEWARSNSGGSGSTGVVQVQAGTGIAITGTPTTPIVNNTGVLSVAAGTGITITGTAANPIVNNAGVLTVSAGSGITITGSAANPIINSSGVATVTAGAGITITGTSTDPVIVNSGVRSITAGTNISLGGTATDPIINAVVAGGGGAAATLFRRTNIAGMAGIDASGFLTSDAHICEVLTVGDFYKWVPGSALTADGITIVNGTGGGAGQWLRLNIPNQTFLRAVYWSVGPGGSDEAQGWGVNHTASDAVKLATMGELNRRFAGYADVTSPPGWFTGYTGPSIHLTGDITVPAFAVLTNLVSKDALFSPRIFSDPVLVDGSAGSRTITAYQPAGMGVGGSPNNERIMTIAGLGTTPQYVLMAVMNASKSKFAWVTRQPATNQLAISQVRDDLGAGANWLLGGLGVVSDFANGDVVSFYKFASIPDWPFSPQVPSPTLIQVQVQNSDSSYVPQGDMGTSNPWLIHVKFGNTVNQVAFSLRGGIVTTFGQGLIVQPLFVGSHSAIVDADWFMYSATVAGATTVACPDGDGNSWQFADEVNVTGTTTGFQFAKCGTCNFPQQNNCVIAAFAQNYVFGFFQCAPTDHHGGNGTVDFYMDDDVKMYGALPGALLAAPSGARIRLNVPGITATIPGASYSSLGGPAGSGQIFINFFTLHPADMMYANLSDIPIFDLQSGSSIAGHQ